MGIDNRPSTHFCGYHKSEEIISVSHIQERPQTLFASEEQMFQGQYGGGLPVP